MIHSNAFPKSQRLCSRHLIEKLFHSNGSKSFSAYPLRLVMFTMEGKESQVLISVPKRCFRHAVDRNRAKRLLREAYRTNRHLLVLPENKCAIMAIIWLDCHHYTSQKVAAKVRNLLQRVSESQCKR